MIKWILGRFAPPSKTLSLSSFKLGELNIHEFPRERKYYKLLNELNEIASDWELISWTIDSNSSNENKRVFIPKDLEDLVCVIGHKEEAIVLCSIELWKYENWGLLIKLLELEVKKIGLSFKQAYASSLLIKQLAHASTVMSDKRSKDNMTDEERNRTKDLFYEILNDAIRVGASDVHIEPRENDAKVRFRIHTELWPWDNQQGGVIPKDVAWALSKWSFYNAADKGSNSESVWASNTRMDWTQSGSTASGFRYKLRMQMNPKLETQGADYIYRILADDVTTSTDIDSFPLERSGLSPDQIEIIDQAIGMDGGIVIIGGIPNSGKTTVIKQILIRAHKRYGDLKKFVSIEDPPEYTLSFVSHGTIQANVNEKERRLEHYADSVKGWLRGNPDVYVAGEIRDHASAIGGISAQEVGCQTFATLHASSIFRIISRLAEKAIGLDVNSICYSDVIHILAYQKLVPVLCPDCSKPFDFGEHATKERIRNLGRRLHVDTKNVRVRHYDSSCTLCQGRGVCGKTLIAEYYRPSDEFLEAIKKGEAIKAKEIYSSLSDNRLDTPFMKGKTVFHHAVYKWLQGQIDLEQVERLGNLDELKPQEVPALKGVA